MTQKEYEKYRKAKSEARRFKRKYLQVLRELKKLKRCGTCQYWYFEEIDQGHICVNDESDHVADWTEECYGCENWKEREDGKCEISTVQNAEKATPGMLA